MFVWPYVSKSVALQYCYVSKSVSVRCRHVSKSVRFSRYYVSKNVNHEEKDICPAYRLEEPGASQAIDIEWRKVIRKTPIFIIKTSTKAGFPVLVEVLYVRRL